MSFDKEMLKKVASSVKNEGVTSSFGSMLRKEAKDIRIAYLTAFIKQDYK